MSESTTVLARLPVRADGDLSRVRQRVREAAVGLGFGLVQQTKLVTAASELARNTLVHGGGGEVTVSEVAGAHGRGLTLRFMDQGPGISDLAQALTDGYTSGGGLGLGLGGAKRLVQEFKIDSTPGGGTTVTVTSWAEPGGSGWR